MHSHVTNTALDFKGIVGKVSLDGVDITTPPGNGSAHKSGEWLHLTGLAGEGLAAGAANASLGWAACGQSTGPLTWHKTEFILEKMSASDKHRISVMLDVSGLSRGHFHLNGHDLGKYWTITNKGQMTQRYHLRYTFIRYSGYFATIFVFLKPN
jgi:hypothetical protein